MRQLQNNTTTFVKNTSFLPPTSFPIQSSTGPLKHVSLLPHTHLVLHCDLGGQGVVSVPLLVEAQAQLLHLVLGLQATSRLASVRVAGAGRVELLGEEGGMERKRGLMGGWGGDSLWRNDGAVEDGMAAGVHVEGCRSRWDACRMRRRLKERTDDPSEGNGDVC